jgi:RNA polymerase sigma-70 factor (ECF subfamily)
VEESELTTEVTRAGAAAYGELDVAAGVVDRAVASLDRAAITQFGAEIYLGLACAAGSRMAVAVLEREFLTNVEHVVARRRLPAHAVDDVRQTVRERLLGGDPPYLATAVGHGSLAGLVAVIATRAALDWLRAKNRAGAHLDETPADLVASSDPERELLRARFASDVKAAFEAAVKELEPRDRTMLRFHLVEGLTIDDVAQLYQIHRATAARQIEQARERVASGVRKSLERATGIRAGELRELTELVTSQLDLSMSRVLASH